MPEAADRLARWQAAGRRRRRRRRARRGAGRASTTTSTRPAAVAAIDEAAAAGEGVSAAAALLGVDLTRRLTRHWSAVATVPDRRRAAPTCRRRAYGLEALTERRDYGAALPGGPGRPDADRSRLGWRVHTRGARERARRTGRRSSAPTTRRCSTRSSLPSVLPRRITFVGKAEYLDDWKTRHLFPALGMIPIDRSGGDAATRALDAAAGDPRAGRAVRHLPRGHPQPRRQAPQGPHRRRPAGPAHRGAARARRHRRHPRDPAARGQAPQPVPPVRGAHRPAHRPAALPRGRGATTGWCCASSPTR